MRRNGRAVTCDAFSSWAVLGLLWVLGAVLGRIGSFVGAFWKPLGGALGFLGHLEAIWVSWVHIAPSWRHLGAIFGLSWNHIGRFGDDLAFGPSWDWRLFWSHRLGARPSRSKAVRLGSVNLLCFTRLWPRCPEGGWADKVTRKHSTIVGAAVYIAHVHPFPLLPPPAVLALGFISLSGVRRACRR